MLARAASCFHVRPIVRLVADDVVRVVEEEDGPLLVAIANGYENGLSVCWAPGSRLVLEILERAWRADAARGLALPERLAAAFAAVRESFPAQAAALPLDVENIGGGPAASLLCVATDGACAVAEWIGEHQALLLRHGAVIARTAPHTLLQKAREESWPTGGVANVQTRVIAAFEDAASPSGRATWSLHAGDHLVLVSHEVPEATVASATSRHPDVMAQKLVDAVRHEHRAFFAACVIGG